MANPIGNPQNLKPYQGTWNHGNTRTIRVPVVLADQVLSFARSIDQGESQIENSSKIDSNHLCQVVELLEEVYKTPRNNFSREKKAVLRTAIDKLIHLTQENQSM
jgi:hypothetical protein